MVITVVSTETVGILYHYTVLWYKAEQTVCIFQPSGAVCFSFSFLLSIHRRIAQNERLFWSILWRRQSLCRGSEIDLCCWNIKVASLSWVKKQVKGGICLNFS